MSAEQQPTVINLDNQSSVQILTQYVELAQQKGAFLLGEAELLKRAADVLTTGAQDTEINEPTAKQLLIQGVHKGQRHGAYTLNDAALLNKVVQFVSGQLPQQPQQSQAQQQPQQLPQQQQPQQLTQQQPQLEQQPSQDLNFNDLSDLAEPIPLKPKEI